jgi:chaperonin GroEL
MKPNEGYNAYSDQYTDLVKEGVIDPVKVTRSRH